MSKTIFLLNKINQSYTLKECARNPKSNTYYDIEMEKEASGGWSVRSLIYTLKVASGGWEMASGGWRKICPCGNGIT